VGVTSGFGVAWALRDGARWHSIGSSPLPLRATGDPLATPPAPCYAVPRGNYFRIRVNSAKFLQEEEKAVARTIAEKIVRRVATIDENKSALEAAILMTEEFIGSVVVTSASKVAGIFTERELMMRVVGKKKVPEKVKIKDVMTKDLIKVSPHHTAGDCLNLMKEHRCRHLMVFDADEFVGLVSLRDIVALMIDEKEELIGHLENYIRS
jgi:signal-transduction protein with cAMP-binding, CBS, and nucleotidyltransferase domain